MVFVVGWTMSWKNKGMAFAGEMGISGCLKSSFLVILNKMPGRMFGALRY